MQRHTLIAVLLAVLLAAGAGYYFWQAHGPSSAPAPPPPAADGSRIEHPLAPAAAAGEPPLPGLADSDPVLGAGIAALFKTTELPAVFYPNGLVRRLVATIDNLPRDQVAASVRLLRPPGGELAVSGQEPSLSLAPENAARYARYAALLTSLDATQMVALYRRFYPLLQQSYEDLGYPGRYFNDRVVAAIDDLLASPEVADPIPLIRPSVMYKFADPRIEGRSAGQKAMIRIGRDHAAAVKAKLREIRTLIATPPTA